MRQTILALFAFVFCLFSIGTPRFVWDSNPAPSNNNSKLPDSRIDNNKKLKLIELASDISDIKIKVIDRQIGKNISENYQCLDLLKPANWRLKAKNRTFQQRSYNILSSKFAESSGRNSNLVLFYSENGTFKIIKTEQNHKDSWFRRDSEELDSLFASSLKCDEVKISHSGSLSLGKRIKIFTSSSPELSFQIQDQSLVGKPNKFLQLNYLSNQPIQKEYNIFLEYLDFGTTSKASTLKRKAKKPKTKICKVQASNPPSVPEIPLPDWDEAGKGEICADLLPSLDQTATPSPTGTATSQATLTPAPSNTPTQRPTSTKTSTPAPTNTATPTKTATAEPTITNTSTPTPANTATPRPSATPTSVPSQTVTSVPTIQVSPTVVPSVSSTPAITATPISEPTVSPSPSATVACEATQSACGAISNPGFPLEAGESVWGWTETSCENGTNTTVEVRCPVGSCCPRDGSRSCSPNNC